MMLLLSLLAATMLGPVPSEIGADLPAAFVESAQAAATGLQADPLVFVSVTHPDDPEPLRLALEDNLREEGFQVVTLTEEERQAGVRPSVDLLVLATVSQLDAGGPVSPETLAITAVWISDETVAHAKRAVGMAQDPLDLAHEAATFAQGLREAIRPGVGRR